ncbi:prephenate dehydratase [Micrococcoides hystricis]|uniref:Prephenate dehydratase n=1 Tax=Micrococcoides hystricis TaxID=1572761 RepID=A0ABV6PB75_9MICC
MRYTFLGPVGTFTEAALSQVIDLADPEHTAIPVSNVETALAQVRSGEADAAMVPIENSVEGGVSATLDAIAEGDQLRIIREVLVPISFVLAAANHPDAATSLSEVKTVATHTHAWAQVRHWADANISQAEYLPSSSTAAAATALANADFTANPELLTQAAVCSPHVVHQLKLNVLANAIEDRVGAVTRFVLVTRPTALPPVTGSDKTSLVIPLPENDRPGALLEILDYFAVSHVNLSRIESRPTGSGLGSYFFSIDVDGHLAEARVQDAVTGVYRLSPTTKFLGSYPRADKQRLVVDEIVSDNAYAAARTWVQSLLSGGR